MGPVTQEPAHHGPPRPAASAAYSALAFLECSRCPAAFYDAGRIQGTCDCGAPLLARYDLERAAALTGPDQIAGRPSSLWRYHELLPVSSPESAVSLGEGLTPLLPMERLGAALGVPGLHRRPRRPRRTRCWAGRPRWPRARPRGTRPPPRRGP